MLLGTMFSYLLQNFYVFLKISLKIYRLLILIPAYLLACTELQWGKKCCILELEGKVNLLAYSFPQQNIVKAILYQVLGSMIKIWVEDENITEAKETRLVVRHTRKQEVMI